MDPLWQGTYFFTSYSHPPVNLDSATVLASAGVILKKTDQKSLLIGIPQLTVPYYTTGASITAIPEGLPADVELAIDAAHKAFNTTWGTNCPGFERGKYLIKIAELMERDLDILASIEALDNGKTFNVAKTFDVGDACMTVRPDALLTPPR